MRRATLLGRCSTFALFAAMFMACSDANLGSRPGGGSSSDDDGGSSSGDGGDKSSGNAGSDPHATCEQYLKCVSDTDPEELPVELQAYGPNGSCWGGDGSLDATCEKACAAAMANQLAANPKTPSCGAGQADEDAGATDPCTQCQEDDCVDAYATCNPDPTSECHDLFACIAACGADSTGDCETTCYGDANLQTQNDYNALAECVYENCRSACGGD